MFDYTNPPLILAPYPYVVIIQEKENPLADIECTIKKGFQKEEYVYDLACAEPMGWVSTHKGDVGTAGTASTTFSGVMGNTGTFGTSNATGTAFPLSNSSNSTASQIGNYYVYSNTIQAKSYVSTDSFLDMVDVDWNRIADNKYNQAEVRSNITSGTLFSRVAEAKK